MAESPADPWQTLSADIFSGMRDWRAQHPHATFREIELELGRPAGPLTCPDVC